MRLPRGNESALSHRVEGIDDVANRFTLVNSRHNDLLLYGWKLFAEPWESWTSRMNAQASRMLQHRRRRQRISSISRRAPAKRQTRRSSITS
jgi:hypothetical protein